jgi:D-alanyl-lipoteichoic acid acyltransferase DltB (MBOAT superfamily)/lysophospholipase L1-like esterase
MTTSSGVVSRLTTIAGASLVAFAIGVELLGSIRAADGFPFRVGLYQAIAIALGAVAMAHGFQLARSPVSLGSAVELCVGTARELAPLVLQLALLFGVLGALELESPAFREILAPLVLVGFVLHDISPPRFRPALFLGLSLTALYLMLGSRDAFWLIATGSLIVALCHLPVRFGVRVALVLAAGGGLAVLRTGVSTVPWSAAVWPILGSLFMFRTAAYLYDVKHGRVAMGWSHRLGYFFLLPNVAFTLFPVVDYSAYKRGYYAGGRIATYQKGLGWMVRGAVQLVLYRVVYQEFTISADVVATWDQLVRHLLSTFLLYLRVSGQFHLVIGILHLFGLNLPETHKAYYLASSFTDFWRRINIYWKDFMMKVVYYPTFFALRARGQTLAMVGATLLVFVATWLLHSYQWFWLLGSFPLTGPDTLFWGALAVLLVANSLWEAKRGRERSLTDHGHVVANGLKRALGVGATFVTITILWSLWSSPSVADWLSLWSRVEGLSPTASERVIPFTLLGGMLLYGAGATLLQRWAVRSTLGAQATVLATVGVLYLVTYAPPQYLPSGVNRLAEAARSGDLNAQDMTRLTRGYYEDLTDVGRFNSQLWEIYLRRPPSEEWPSLQDTEAMRETGDFLRHELVPSVSIRYQGHLLTVNRWGMRDRDYELAPRPNVPRVALLGASIEMGWGVGDGDAFESVLERLLSEDERVSPVEVLNFAVADYTLPQQPLVLDRASAWRPSLVLVATHDVDAGETIARLIERADAGVAIPFEELALMADDAGLGTAPVEEVGARLRAVSSDIEAWALREIARRAEEIGARAVWVRVPMAYGDPEPGGAEASRALAEEAGLITIDLSSAFEGIDLETLQVWDFDFHPNEQGHRLLADRLYEAIVNHPDLLAALGRPVP